MTAAMYRVFDTDDALLYVGSSADYRSRLETHRSTAPWWSEAERITATVYRSLHEARDAEVLAIFHEQPRDNVFCKNREMPAPTRGAASLRIETVHIGVEVNR